MHLFTSSLGNVFSACVPWWDLYSFDSKRVQCLGMIKYLVVRMVQIPRKFVIMDVVIPDVPPTHGMLLFRHWGTSVGTEVRREGWFLILQLLNIIISRVCLYGNDWLWSALIGYYGWCLWAMSVVWYSIRCIIYKKLRFLTLYFGQVTWESPRLAGTPLQAFRKVRNNLS